MLLIFGTFWFLFLAFLLYFWHYAKNNQGWVWFIPFVKCCDAGKIVRFFWQRLSYPHEEALYQVYQVSVDITLHKPNLDYSDNEFKSVTSSGIVADCGPLEMACGVVCE